MVIVFMFCFLADHRVGAKGEHRDSRVIRLCIRTKRTYLYGSGSDRGSSLTFSQSIVTVQFQTWVSNSSSTGTAQTHVGEGRYVNKNNDLK